MLNIVGQWTNLWSLIKEASIWQNMTNQTQHHNHTLINFVLFIRRENYSHKKNFKKISFNGKAVFSHTHVSPLLRWIQHCNSNIMGWKSNLLFCLLAPFLFPFILVDDDKNRVIPSLWSYWGNAKSHHMILYAAMLYHDMDYAYAPLNCKLGH